MTSFTNLNKTILYTKVRSRNDAIKLREEVIGISGQGKSVVVFFNKRYHLQLASGHDPYLVRQEINDWMSKHKHISFKTPDSKTVPSVTIKSENKPKDMPERDASGKFISASASTGSKKQNTQKEDSSTNINPPKKKSFWDSLR